MVLHVIKTYQKLSKVIKSYQKCKTSKTVNTEKQSAMTVRNGPKLPNTAQNDPKLFRITNNGGSQAPEPAPPGFETGAATFSQSENDKRDHLCRSQGCYQSHGWGGEGSTGNASTPYINIYMHMAWIGTEPRWEKTKTR